ncbi:ArsR/SmtB family transcription factor [Streptomyces achromogenes]|uniref:ArsR/SmtB family transcription factor n=1 Tax=Streptomyces achromogenes TaxID=67255 RepID=UPI0036F8D5F3
MIRFRLDMADLADTSFAYSALQETVLSLRAWTHPDRFPRQYTLLATEREAFEAGDTALLTALVARRRPWVPDFLTPRPTTSVPAPEAEFAALRAADPAGLSDDIARVFRPLGEPVPARLAAGLARPATLLADIADALWFYWNNCLAPYWPRIRSVLEADIVHRARVLAGQGTRQMFAGLDSRLFWQDGYLAIRQDSESAPWPDVPVHGRGVLLTPSCFALKASTMLGQDAPPHIVYPARGLATLTERARLPTPPEALERLMGRPRAQLLALLAEPASTTELARRLDVTPAAVSQHLSVLTAAGLTRRARHGRLVLYSLSTLGTALSNPGRAPDAT